MRRVEADALVGASRDEVWQLYDDIAGTPRWVPSVREILYVSGPARVGTVYRERNRIATAQWEIVEHRRPTRQVHVSDEGVTGAGADPDVRGARLGNLGPPGARAALAPLGARRLGARAAGGDPRGLESRRR